MPQKPLDLILLMTTRTRATIFWFFVFLFIVGGTGTILFVSGYRLNLETGKMEKVGGAFVKTNIPNYDVTLDGKHFSKQYAVTNELFIPSLTPGTYTFEVKKEGYRSWKKQFTVLPRIVTSFKSTLLIPNPLTPESLFQKIFELKSFSISKNTANILLPDPREKSLTLYSLDAGDVIKTIKEKDAQRIRWLSDNTSFFYTTPTTKSILFVSGEKTINVTTAFPRSLSSIASSIKSTIANIYPHPFEKKLIIQTVKNGVYVFDPFTAQSVLLTDINPLTVTVQGSSIIFLDNKGQLYSEHLITKNVNKLTLEPLSSVTSHAKDQWNILISPDEKTFVLSNVTSRELFISTKETGKFSLLDTNATSPSFAFDSRKLAYTKGNTPILYWIVKDEESRKEEGQKDTLYVELPVTNLTWYRDNAHLFGYTSEKELYFFETDNRTPLETLLISTDVPDYFYHEDSNTLFYLNSGNLLKLDFNFSKN